jgi:uncharacterized membrane protein YukC
MLVITFVLSMKRKWQLLTIVSISLIWLLALIVICIDAALYLQVAHQTALLADYTGKTHYGPGKSCF